MHNLGDMVSKPFKADIHHFPTENKLTGSVATEGRKLRS